MATNRTSPHGFTLIVAMIVISTVLVLVSATVAQGLMGHALSSITIERKLQAKSAAEACADVALLELTLDPAYAGNESVTIGSNSCTIQAIVSGPPTVVETEATVSGNTYRLHIELSELDPIMISAWERVADF